MLLTPSLNTIDGKPIKKSKSISHYAIDTRQQLAERHKNTDEVHGILAGEGYKTAKPKYVSKPDVKLAEI